MVARKSQIPFCVICCLLAAGCDPMRPTTQLVRLRVVDSASQQPVEGVKVSLTYDYITAEPLPPKHWDMTPEEWAEYQRENLDCYLAFSSSTDNRGQADIDLNDTVVHPTRESNPLAGADHTGKPYLLSLKEGQFPEEEWRVVLELGASVEGKAYTVTVIDIEKPRYVSRAEYDEWSESGEVRDP